CPLAEPGSPLGGGLGEPPGRRARALVLLIRRLPATLLERAQFAVGALVDLCGGIGGSPSLHPIGHSLERRAEAERAFGERFRVGGAVLLAFAGGELDRLAFAHDARHALAERRADEHLVAA